MGRSISTGVLETSWARKKSQIHGWSNNIKHRAGRQDKQSHKGKRGSIVITAIELKITEYQGSKGLGRLSGM